MQKRDFFSSTPTVFDVWLRFVMMVILKFLMARNMVAFMYKDFDIYLFDLPVIL